MLGESSLHGVKKNLLPTPPLPEDLNPVVLTNNARQVLT